MKIDKFNKRLENLRSERSSFISQYQDLSDYFLSHRGRFLTSDRNKGKKRFTRQFNNKGRMATRTLGSGLMAGATSQARPWFRIAAPSFDPDLGEYTPVKEWLHIVQQIMYSVFSRSNFYNSIHVLYEDFGVFGTPAMGVYQDFNNVIWCQPEPVGSFMLGTNGKEEVDTRYREFEKTVGQVVKEYGYENCSKATQRQWDKGNTEAWVKIIHAIEPNDDRDMMSPMARDKRFRSVHYEYNCSNSSEEHKFLRRSGFDTFPIFAPRWSLAAGDIYATSCPGMDSIGDNKALQLGEKRSYQAMDKVANPPLQGPPEMKNITQKGHLQGSEILYVDQASGGLSSVYGNWRPDIGAIELKNRQAEERISAAFYEDLFLMISNSDRRQITAREIAEKQEEKLLMLGPALERLHTELLNPIIDRTFDILQNAGVLPPPPEELRDKELEVEYVSILAQAQRMVATTATERLFGFAGQVAGLWPEVRHKLDPMQAVDEYAHSVGVDPKIVRADDEAEEIIEGERQAAAAQQARISAAETAEMAKTASQADTAGENALTRVMDQAGLS